MDWKPFLVASILALGALLTVAEVGLPRQPITRGEAVVTVIINTILIWLVLS